MNLEDQLQPTPVDLSKTTVEDLVQELKSRFHTLVMIGLCDVEDEGPNTLVSWYQGSRVTAIGLVEDFKHDLLQGRTS